jgi:hypothetical protein
VRCLVGSEMCIRDSYGAGGKITVEIRHDDQCKNGHNSFAITATVLTTESMRRRDIAAGGCMHDEIAQVFPELAHLIKWHLSITDGPMYYIENTLYFAGDRDAWGRVAGEPSSFSESIIFGSNPIAHKVKPKFWQWLQDCAASGPGQPRFDFEVIRVDHDDKGKPGNYQYSPQFTYGGYDVTWAYCPFNSEQEARDFLYALQHCEPRFVKIPTAWSEGKARELEAARRAAVWPDATDEHLCLPRDELKALLEARLPALLDAFRADVESIGFQFVAVGDEVTA